MTRRGPKSTTHVHRDAKANGVKADLLLHRHRLLRRSSGFMLARKYRNPWPTESDFARELSSRFMPRAERTGSEPAAAAPASNTGSTSSNNSVVGLNGPKGYSREELINFWRELSLVAKRRLLRIRRETYLTALDQFLVGQNLCCECHDNVIAEWEDHERKRSGSRSLQDVFSVFPPFLDDDDESDEDADDDDESDENEDEDDEADELDESDEDMLAAEDMVLEEEELVFKYELEREGRRGDGGKGGMLSDEYLAALEVGKRQEDELLRLIQKEERYIIIREDHTDFIMDLIRCGEQFSYVSPFRSGFDDDESEDSEDDEDVDDTCPGANTSHLAQEYLLEVLAIKFREQLEDAYQEALQHSLAIQAELLRDELADLKASQKPSSSSRKKKNKKEKKRRKKEAAAQRATEKVSPRDAATKQKPSAAKPEKTQPALALTDGSGDSETEVRDPEEDEIDREVEQFRLLLEKINAESELRSRKKLVLPPGSFAHLTSMTVSAFCRQLAKLDLAIAGKKQLLTAPFMPSESMTFILCDHRTKKLPQSAICTQEVRTSQKSVKTMARLRSQQPAEAPEGSDLDATVCVVCQEQLQRVTVSCSTCAKLYHLSCLTPPLRRRPLADAWKCSDCKGAGDEEKEKSRAAGNKRKAPVKKEEEQPSQKRRRVSTRSTRQEETHKDKEEEDEFEDKSIATTLPKRQNGKAPMKKKTRSPPAPKPRTNGRTARRASSRTAAIELSDDEDDDNDRDSDFVGESVSESEEDDEDSAEMSSDEDNPPTRRRPITKTIPLKQRNGEPNPARQPAAPLDISAYISTINDAGASDVDSLDIEIVGESEQSDDEDLYEAPQYFVEYAANGRAKCKSCEKKFYARQLRVGIAIRHSIFGDTIYYKHLECTEIGLKAGSAVSQAEEDPDAEDGGKKKQKKKVKDPIEGLSKLQAADQKRVREYLEKNDAKGIIDERLPLSDDHFNKKGRMPEKEPSKYLTATLLPYQREALAWMVGQEEGSYKGGILADEMGMGKTIQAISLILENVREGGPPPKQGKAAKGRKPAVVRGGTLVVCPLVAVMQWQSEIERFVEPGHLSVYIHHGPKRLDLVEKIASYDIVLTTYSIIESEIRKTLGRSKVACKYCGKKYLPDKLVSHNKYFCGPNARKTVLQDKQQKKRPAKKAAGETSEDEENEDFKKSPQKPKGRAKPPAKTNNDGDKQAPLKSMGKAPLHQIHWTRIVLDEAHYIKDRNCNTARGVFELKSTYKWCLSGTPLQNRIGELFSLVRFLQVKKYAYYHCNMCECQMLDYNFPDKKCVQCTHSAIQHYSYFNKKVVIPIQAYGYVAEGKLAMQRLQNDVLQHILLRRTKEGRADDISLPPKLVRIRKDRLDERENDFYEAIYTQSQAQFNTYVSSGTLLNNYAHIFDLLIRLRQAVDHPYLVIYSKSNPALQLPNSAAQLVEEQPFVTNGSSGSEDDRSCTICHEYVEDGVVAKCGHEFCRECVKEYIESLPAGGKATCPTCSKPLTVDLSPPVAEVGNDDVSNDTISSSSCRSPKTVNLSSFHKNSILHRISDIHAFQSSTKVEALMQELELMRIRDPSGKAIIFSQFVNMLDIIQHRLQLGGVKCVKLSGNMSMAVRDRTIKAFRDDPTVTAFLISLKAGGVALNLTVASHIFLMDPWWNPAAENQAIDRTHRLGQFKPIQATRFIIAGTVEERILKLQEKKRLIFEGTVGGNVSAICRLTEEDLRFLFTT